MAKLIRDDLYTLTEEDKKKLGIGKEVPFEAGDKYWYVNNYGNVDWYEWTNNDEDNYYLNTGNCYHTEAEANKAAEQSQALARVRGYIREHHPFVPDWSDEDQIKHYIYYGNKTGSFYHTGTQRTQDALTLPHLPSAEACQDVIKNCEADLKLIWNVS